MLSTIDRLKITGLALVVKRRFTNSVINSSIPDTTIAKKLKISPTNYKKLKKRAIHLGLLRKSGNNYVWIPMVAVFKKLDLVASDNLGFIKILNSISSEGFTYKQCYEHCAESLVLQGFHAQNFNIKRRKEQTRVARRLSNCEKTHKDDIPTLRRLVKAAKKEGISLDSHCASVLSHESGIVTGSYYLAKKLSTSQRTANNILNRMHNKCSIIRTTVRFDIICTICEGSFMELKYLYPKSAIFHLKDMSGFRVVRGSDIQLTEKK